MWRVSTFIKESRRRVISLIDRIPRKLQVLINLLLIPIFLVLLYIFINSPTFTPEQAYRRFEKANLVGPSEILGYETVTQRSPQEFLLAETKDGIIISVVRQPKNYRAEDFLYLEKKGDITVTPAPQELHWEYGGEQILTMFLFDEYPQAVYAELDFELFWYNGGHNVYRHWYNLKADRKNDGYFRFDLEFTHNEFKVDVQAEEIYQLSRVFYFPNDWELPEDAYPAVIRLFDAEGNEIVNKDTYLFS